MTMASSLLTRNFRYVADASVPYRKRYGFTTGMKLWNSARQTYKLKDGELFSIKTPDLKAPVWLRAGTSDIKVFQQVICSGETDFDLGLNPTLAIDAGANIGLSSIVIASRYPNCKIVALEVDDENFEILKKNVAGYPNIIAKKQALWPTSGFVKIANPEAESWAFQVVEADPTETGAIRTTTVSDIAVELSTDTINLLKIDIEGGEFDLFKNGTPIWLSQVKILAVELHDRFRPGCTEVVEAALRSSAFAESSQGEYRVFSRSG